MKTVAIVSEFNPFHNGHGYLLDSVRATLGEDTCIIAIMSGNYTQRGDVAIVDKFTRAAMAIEGGVDLVLEIPFPFSVASAEFYAGAGIRMAASLGVVDAFAFGSECGDLDALTELATNLSSELFQAALRMAVDREGEKGHARITEEVYSRLYGKEGAALLRSPNNVLGIEYLRANAALPHPLTPITFRRRGEYHDTELAGGISASAVRAALLRGEALDKMMPPASARILADAVLEQRAPADLSRLGNVFLAYFRTTPCPASDDIGHRLRDAAIRAADFHEFTMLAATKRYTNARIRRTLWHRFFGITSAELSETPAYSQVLGMNARGRAALRRAAKLSTLSLLTKPADARSLPERAARQAERSQRADLLFSLAMPRAVAGNSAILAAPYRKD